MDRSDSNSATRGQIAGTVRRLVARLWPGPVDTLGPPIAVVDDAAGPVPSSEQRLLDFVRTASSFEQGAAGVLRALVPRARDGLGLVLSYESGMGHVRAARGLGDDACEAFARVAGQLGGDDGVVRPLAPVRFRELGLYDALSPRERTRGQDILVCRRRDVLVVVGYDDSETSRPFVERLPSLVDALAARPRGGRVDPNQHAVVDHESGDSTHEAVRRICLELSRFESIEQVSVLFDGDFGGAYGGDVWVGPKRLPGVENVWREHERRIVTAVSEEDDVRTFDGPVLVESGVDTLIGWACAAHLTIRGRNVGTICATSRTPVRGVAARDHLTACRDAIVRILDDGPTELVESKADEPGGERDLLAYASHEIRTPMNGILGMTRFLEGTATTPEQRQYLDVLRTTSEDLLRTVDGVLEGSRGHREETRQATSLRRVLGSALRTLGGLAAEKGLALVLDVDPDVPERFVVDEAGLRQVVLNLVGNAIKFTSRGEVVVSVGLREEDAGTRLHFEVRDTGIGIAEDRLDAIFEDYVQAERTTKSLFGGTGLGLGICREIVARMGAKLSVRSTLNIGTIFSFEVVLPTVDDEGEDAIDPPRLDGRTTHVNVENASLERAVRRQLLAWGATIADSPDGVDLAVCQWAGDASKRCAGQVRLVRPGDTSNGDATVVLQPFSSDDLAEAVRAALSESPTTESPNETASPTDGEFVLLVDDDPINRVLCSEFVRRAGFEPVTAGDGHEALALVAEREFAAILLDVSLPDVQGDELAAALRVRGVLVPLIGVTGYTDAATEERLFAAGVDAKLDKPVDEHVLIETLRRLVDPPNPSSDDKGDDVFAPSVDDPELIDELVGMYLETYPKVLAELRDAVSALDGAGIATHAHRLKGSAAAIGGLASEQALARLENCECEPVAVAEAMTAAERELERLRERLVRTVPAASR